MFGDILGNAASGLSGIFGGSKKAEKPKNERANINWNDLGDFVLKAGSVAAPVLASVFGKPGNTSAPYPYPPWVNPYMPWGVTMPPGLQIPGLTTSPNVPAAAPSPAPAPIVLNATPPPQSSLAFGLDNQTLLMLGGGLLLIVLLNKR